MTFDRRLGRRTLLQAIGAGAAGAATLPWASGTAAASTAARQTPAGPQPPLMHGYSAAQIKAWRPDTDPRAPYFRSRVALAERIPAFAATQARPDLDPRPRLMALANDYVQPGHETEGYPYGAGFEAYALRFWQYPDLYASWHGLPLPGEHDADQPRYGLLNLPNPGYTDAAHRNGVPSLGCWFWPRPEEFAEVVEQRADGSFPLADKLIEMAGYFGFDGYFINQEAQIPAEHAELLLQLFEYLARHAPAGFHVQWYDSLTVAGQVSYQNEFNEVNSPWLVAPDGTRICDSIFLNYWWNAQRMQRSHEHALTLGLDPYQVVYSGQEIGLNRFAQPYDPRHIFPVSEPPRTSWAFLGSEMVWYTVPGAKDTVTAQAPAYRRERHLWTGPREDPSRTGRLAEPDPAAPLDPAGWDGTAHHIVEKSVIGATPFVTSFCAGTGTQFFLSGERVGDQPWFHIGIQDLLPTWQWWVRDGDDRPSEAVTVDYDYATAWDGGSCLHIAGGLAAGSSAVVRLFKTRLPVGPRTAVELIHQVAGGPEVAVGLAFEDDPQAWQWLPVTPDEPSGDWSRWQRPLADWAGRVVAAIAVAVRAGAEAVPQLAVRLGRLAVTDLRPGPRPAPPSRVRLDRMVRDGDLASVYLQWRGARHATGYDLFHRRGPDRVWVGRTNGEAFCVSALAVGDQPGVLEIESVTVEGNRSAPTRLRLE